MNFAGEPVPIDWEPARRPAPVDAAEGNGLLAMYWFAVGRHFAAVRTLETRKAGRR